MRVFKLKYKEGRSSKSWYYSFYWRARKSGNGNFGTAYLIGNIDIFTKTKDLTQSAKSQDLKARTGAEGRN